MDTQAIKLDNAIESSLHGSFGRQAATMALLSLETASQPRSLNNVLKQTPAMILAVGQGERLSPLTRDRAKPAVPFGGIYRIIDFTLSNCLNSGIRKMHVLTQYKSHSLARHIKQAWNLFPSEMDECIDVLPPQQRTAERWYQGTADAIYQNIYTLQHDRPQVVLILGGDHIYKMDYGEMITAHLERAADLTIACTEVPRAEATHFGVLGVDESRRIHRFQEKPSASDPLPDNPDHTLASMGIYVFNTDVLVRELGRAAQHDTCHDLGKNIIPHMVRNGARAYASPFRDRHSGAVKYWRDIGTLDSYFEANMDLVSVSPLFNLYDQDWPIRTY